MRKIILISLVFFSAFVKAQVTIDPETFPIVPYPIGKFVYTNTGGEGKILVDSIVRVARNGVNGQDSSGLGGSLNQNTNIFMNGYNWMNYSVYPVIFGGTNPLGLGYGHNINGCLKSIGQFASNNDLVLFNGANLDTCTSVSELLFQALEFGTNTTKQFKIQKQGSNIEMYINTDRNSNVGILWFDKDIYGQRSFMTIQPNNYDGQWLFDVRNNLGDGMFRVEQDRVFIKANQYNDDADAGANGLSAGYIYQTSPTNTLGLPAGVLMIKQ